MNVNTLRRKTFLVILCCLILVCTMSATHGALWSPPPWLVSLWNFITGMKDAVEGIESLISALQTDIEEAKDGIAARETRQNGHLKARNKVKKNIQPEEQEQSAAAAQANAAAATYNAASSRASTLRSDIADLNAELSGLSPSSDRYNQVLVSLIAKDSLLSQEEATMAMEKGIYDSATARYHSLRRELQGDRDYIAYLTGLIDQCTEDIDAYNAKITKIEKRIKAEKARRDKIKDEIKVNTDKYNKLLKAAQQN